MSKPIVVSLLLTFKPEAVEDFCASIQEMLKDTAKRPGFIAIRILRQAADPNQILFVEDWDSEAAYQGYIAWRTERGDMDGMATMLAAPPQIGIWPKLVAHA